MKWFLRISGNIGCKAQSLEPRVLSPEREPAESRGPKDRTEKEQKAWQILWHCVVCPWRLVLTAETTELSRRRQPRS